MTIQPVPTAPTAQPFKLRAPLLERGNGDTPMYQTDLMWMHIKVYAEGGENDLHMHPKEEHSFIVLEGEATFYDKDETPTVVGKYEGILLPKGTLYHFRNSGEGNLVMLRTGAGVNNHLPGKEDERRGPDGKPMPHNPSAALRGQARRVEVPGKFFGA